MRGPLRILPALPVAVAALLAAGCEPPTVPERRLHEAYDFTLPTVTGDTLVLRWPAGTAIRVWAEDVDAHAPLRTALERGAALWNERALFGEYRIVPAAARTQADVLLAWAPGSLPVRTDGCPPQTRRGTTTFCMVEEDGRRRLAIFPLAEGQDPGRVRMLVTFLREGAGAPADLPALVAHELGHVLGLMRHSPEPLDLMFDDPAMPPALSLRDAVTVQVLYRTRADVTP